MTQNTILKKHTNLLDRFATSTLSCAISRALLCSTLIAVSQSAHSQIQSEAIADIERIEVSADLSSRDLYQLPGSNLVLGDDLIEGRESRHLQDLVAALPNVNFSAGASRGKFIQIRGIGERSQFAEPINPSIGLLIDDIDISGLGSLATLFDVQQVELLSGPQSVATGISSLGGVIKIVSNDAPQDLKGEHSGRFAASFGQQGALRLGGAYAKQISESFSMRVSAQINQEDGFVENAFLNTDDTNNIDEKSATLFLKQAFRDDSILSAKLYHFDIENGYDAFSLDNDNITQSDQPGFDNAKASAASLKYQSALASANFEATVTYLDGDFDYGYDEDWTFPEFHPFSYSSFDDYQREVTRTSVDLRLSSLAKRMDNISALTEAHENEWLLGVSYRSADEDLLRIYTFAEDFNSQYEPVQSSVYGQYLASVNDKTTLTLAARVEQFKADYVDSNAFVEALDDTLFAGSVAIDYELFTRSDSQPLLYASLSRGYKAGGFNLDQRLDNSDRVFAPEYNWNLETGIKGSLLAGMARYQFSVFYMRREDAQVSDFAVFENPQDDGSVVTSFADAVRNTDTGINQGAEFTSNWQLSDKWSLDVNAGYLDATFGDYTRLDGSFLPEQDQAQAPAFTAYVASNLVLGDNWSWFIDIDAKDEYRFSVGHDERAPFTLVVNSNIAWENDAHLVRLWVKNLFDRQIFTRGFGGFSNDPRDEYAFVEPYFQFGQERQLGLSYEYRL